PKPIEEIDNGVKTSSITEEHIESPNNNGYYSRKEVEKRLASDELELFLLQLLRENLIECNTTRTGYFVNSIFTSIGDGGINLFDIREFSAVLAKQAEGTVGFFVTNSTYSINACNEASNSKQQIILCMKDNVIEKIKATKLNLENKELQKNSFELNDLVIKDLEIDSDEST
ncbi:17520_t:CDS:2, partial [Racocetra persica]